MINFVLAGSHFPTSLSIFATFNEKIESGDINALQSANSKYIKSQAAERYRNRGLLLAAQNSDASVVELLLKEANVDAASVDNKAIRMAAENGNVDIVRMLLNRPAVNPGVMNNEALISAAKNGHIEIFRLLLANPKVDPAIRGGEATIWATTRNRLDILKLLMNDKRVDRIIFRLSTLQRAASFGNDNMVRFLLAHPYFRKLAHQVVIYGDLTSIRTMVDSGYLLDLDILDMTLQYARSRGDTDIVEYLEPLNHAILTDDLKDKILVGDINALQSIIHSNPIIKSQAAERYRNDGLLLAVQNSRSSVVELLLKEANVDAASSNNRAIRSASVNENVDIFRMLLERPEVNPGANNNVPLVSAAKNGHTEIVRLLLANPKVDPYINGGRAVFEASSFNHADIVKLLIRDGRAESTTIAVHTLERAAHFENVDLVRFLLTYPSFTRIVNFIIVNDDLKVIKTVVEAGYKLWYCLIQ